MGTHLWGRMWLPSILVVTFASSLGLTPQLPQAQAAPASFARFDGDPLSLLQLTKHAREAVIGKIVFAKALVSAQTHLNITRLKLSDVRTIPLSAGRQATRPVDRTIDLPGDAPFELQHGQRVLLFLGATEEGITPIVGAESGFFLIEQVNGSDMIRSGDDNANLWRGLGHACQKGLFQARLQAEVLSVPIPELKGLNSASLCKNVDKWHFSGRTQSPPFQARLDVILAVIRVIVEASSV